MNKPEVKPAKQTQQTPKKISKEDLARQINRLRERDSEIVYGVFKNLEILQRQAAAVPSLSDSRNMMAMNIDFMNLWTVNAIISPAQ